MAGFQKLLAELRRRRIFRTAGIYIVAAWVAVQVASLIFPAIEVSDAALRYVWLAALLLFPLALVFSWFFDVTPTGLNRTPPLRTGDAVDLSLRKTDYAILAALTLVGVAIAWQASSSIQDSVSVTVAKAIEDVNPNSIAVLPLENLSDDPEQQYFVSAMQGALISSLSRIASLRITSKTSTLRFRDTVTTIPQIGSQLGVAKLIEGSVFKAGDRVRITLKLLDAQADEQIWSKTFEEDVTDLINMQNRIAQEIADQVEGSIPSRAQAQRKTSSGTNAAAYDAFMRGQFHVERFTPPDMALAAQYFQQAVDLDPDLALAHWGLSKLCAFQAQAGLITSSEARERCWPPTERALELDETLPEAHLGYATHLGWREFDWVEAEVGYKRALKLNPSYAEARIFYSHYLTMRGRTAEGKAQMKIGLQLDPYNPFMKGLYAAQLFMIDDFENSIKVIDEVMASTPGFGFGHIVAWNAYFALGEKDMAIASAANHFRITRGDETGAIALEEAYVGGDFQSALIHAADALTVHAQDKYVPPIDIALLYEQAGQDELAIDWLEKAVRNYDPDAPYIGVVIKSASIRKNPRFIILLRDMKHDYWADRLSQSSDE